MHFIELTDNDGKYILNAEYVIAVRPSDKGCQLLTNDVDGSLMFGCLDSYDSVKKKLLIKNVIVE